MTNLEKYNEAFSKSLLVTEEQLTTLNYQSVAGWDSVGHMSLITTLEETFDIMMDMDDIVDFSSYSKGIEILKKYGIKF
jgi:acyl carrier protein